MPTWACQGCLTRRPVRQDCRVRRDDLWTSASPTRLPSARVPSNRRNSLASRTCSLKATAMNRAASTEVATQRGELSRREQAACSSTSVCLACFADERTPQPAEVRGDAQRSGVVAFSFSPFAYRVQIGPLSRRGAPGSLRLQVDEGWDLLGTYCFSSAGSVPQCITAWKSRLTASPVVRRVAAPPGGDHRGRCRGAAIAVAVRARR